MTLETAIENAFIIAAPGPIYLNKDNVKAIKLGIEALKREQHYRSMNQPCYHRPLPGETEK